MAMRSMTYDEPNFWRSDDADRGDPSDSADQAPAPISQMHVQHGQNITQALPSLQCANESLSCFECRWSGL